MGKIILTGYMGSGKTTVARALGKQLHCKVLDLDQVIAQEEGLALSEIFQQRGEIYFRKVERQKLKALLESPENFVLSLGGGTPCYAGNHELLKSPGVISVYLKASVATLAKRLRKSKTSRPLLDKLPENELEEFIAKHLFDRSYYYNQARFKVSIDGKNVAEIVNEIAAL